MHSSRRLGLATKAARRISSTIPVARKLREVMKLSIVEKEDPSTIKDIWTKFHANKLHMVAKAAARLTQAFEQEHYDPLKSKLRESPMFIYPVRRSGGHFTLVGQAQDNILVVSAEQLFAHMHDFKQNSVLTTPIMILVFFEELLQPKRLVLARADVVDKSLSREEANRVFSQVLMFYGTGELYQRFVLPFNRDPEGFNYGEYSKLMEISRY